MKRILPFLFIILILVSCQSMAKESLSSAPEGVEESIDYCEKVKLDMSTSSKKVEATVISYIDGDTTYFSVPASVSPDGILKARYIAVNTPESTGKIEEWGKSASYFTRERLSNAESIIIESDTDEWNLDSTGTRMLVWIWYRDSSSSEYRNLNIELLQEGLAIPYSSSNNRYGSYAQDAIRQAQREKKHIWSNERDPNFYYGDIIEVTLKELRLNAQEYEGKKVSFEAVVTKYDDNSVYVENLDEESGYTFGICVFYGFSFPGAGLDILRVGNKVKIVGTVQYYERGGSYQISGIKYRQMKPDDEENIRLIAEGEEIIYTPVSLDYLLNSTIEITDGDEIVPLIASSALQATTVEVDNLYVESIEYSSNSSMTLLCSSNGNRVLIRGENLKDISATSLLRKTISVKGIVDRYSGSVQIKVLSSEDISIEK